MLGQALACSQAHPLVPRPLRSPGEQPRPSIRQAPCAHTIKPGNGEYWLKTVMGMGAHTVGSLPAIDTQITVGQ